MNRLQFPHCLHQKFIFLHRHHHHPHHCQTTVNRHHKSLRQQLFLQHKCFIVNQSITSFLHRVFFQSMHVILLCLQPAPGGGCCWMTWKERRMRRTMWVSIPFPCSRPPPWARRRTRRQATISSPGIMRLAGGPYFGLKAQSSIPPVPCDSERRKWYFTPSLDTVLLIRQ